MKKCAQCGNEFPVSNNSCPKCGYGEAGFANNGAVPNSQGNKVVKIVIIVIAVMVLVTSIGIFTFSKFIFKNVVDMGKESLEGGFSTSTAEECSSACDGSYMYVNGTCSCMNIEFE